MFAIEHVVFPARFLDEAWRVLRPGRGCLLLIAPDFANNAMTSERIGFSYGSGREKLGQGKVRDALLTAYDSRVRLSAMRWLRKRGLAQGSVVFPVLADPRCLHLPGFVPDCDAVYPACPEEISNYLRRKTDCGPTEVFYRDPSNFGFMARKMHLSGSANGLDRGSASCAQ